MRYLPHTEGEIATMLAEVGATSIDELFAAIPREFASGQLRLPPPLDEGRLMRHLETLAGQNEGAQLISFLGAGAYEHHLPPAVDQLLLRSEFYTSYTPYQPEVAQGTLQAIFEFQTIVSEILGLPVANASMYDGASAAAEAVLMARRLSRREEVWVAGDLHPHTRETIETYLQGIGAGKASLQTLPLLSTGLPDLGALEGSSSPPSCVVLSYPSFYGGVADLRQAAELVHAKGALLITITQDPFALSVLEPPGRLGVDIAVAEGQPLGIPLQFGGPSAGLFACRDGRDYLQQMPGRLAGQTIDKNGERGYVLTLATREQHIRRERATSNICTNSGLCALSVAIRMCMLGRSGFVETGRQCLAKAEYLKRAVAALPGYTLVYPETPTFHEFVLRVRNGNASRTVDELVPHGFLAGFDLGRLDAERRDQLLVAVTERPTREELDRFVSALNALHPTQAR